MLESHTGPVRDLLNIENFWHFINSRQKSNNNRYFGGQVIYVKNSLRPGVKIIKSSNSEITWLKLDKVYFAQDKDIYLAFVYIPPANSTFYAKSGTGIESLYRELEDDIAAFSLMAYTFILGDFNAYTSTSPDYIELDDVLDDHLMTLPNNYHALIPSPRNNLDGRATNDSGSLLLSLCKNSSCLILNGRSQGDKQGAFTRYPWHDLGENRFPSVIDYALYHSDSYEKVKDFYVHSLSHLSDHCALHLKINMGLGRKKSAIVSDSNNLEIPKTSTMPDKFLWNSDCIWELNRVFNSEEGSKEFNDFQNETFDMSQTGVDEAGSKLTNIITNLADKVVPTKTFNKITGRNKRKQLRAKAGHKWYDKDCHKLKNRMNRIAARFKKDPFNLDLHSHYRSAYFFFFIFI